MFISFILLCILNLLLIKQITKDRIYSKKAVLLTAIVLICFPVYIISQHYHKTYTDTIALNIKFGNNDSITLSGKHPFIDEPGFVFFSTSKELKAFIIKEGELLNDTSGFDNVIISKDFKFLSLESITLQKINETEVPVIISWKATELKGNADILLPKY